MILNEKLIMHCIMKHMQWCINICKGCKNILLILNFYSVFLKAGKKLVKEVEKIRLRHT